MGPPQSTKAGIDSLTIVASVFRSHRTDLCIGSITDAELTDPLDHKSVSRFRGRPCKQSRLYKSRA